MENEEMEIVEDISADNVESDGIEEIEIPEVTNEESQELELSDTSESEPKEEVKTYTQIELDRIIENRLARERKNYKPLVETLKAGGYETDDPLELTSRLRKTYEEQGIELPKYSNNLTEREQKALAKVDAEEIIECGEEVMKETFNELYKKSNRTPREEQTMYLIGKENSTRMAKRDLLGLGVDPNKILNDKKFMDFARKVNAPIKEIYSMYQKINGIVQAPPPSAGSVKNNNNDGQKYTQAKIDNMTSKQLAECWDDPEFRKIAGL